MRTIKISALLAGTFLAAASLMSGTDARSDTTYVGGGTAAVYGNLPPDQVEFLSPPDRIKAVANSGSPSLIWETLEHGEAVECLDCIPAVGNLLYSTDPQTREIAAWWLRRRIFGVFGPGQVYEQTVNTLKGDPSPDRREAAAYALGEFLTLAGVPPLASAIQSDSSPAVRAAAASALGRINDKGGTALSTAMKDADPSVRLAAIKSAGRINDFTDEATPASLLGDNDAVVRRRAVELLEDLHAKDTVTSVMTLAKTDADERVRIAACHALGTFGDVSAQTTLQGIATSDASTLVRDAATIALRRL
ncbi:MAG TPA: HEAT repeat domain-containing protein [Polyangiaceae bacterium]|nr:HEAT repeat domain-containing protein [Polyangiaceae bacterium]